MNIEGKTISTVRRHQDTGILRITFTDGAATDLELDSFRLVRIVPVYPSDRDLMPLSETVLNTLRAEHAASIRPLVAEVVLTDECSGPTIADLIADGHLATPESTPASALDSQVAGDHYKKLGMYQPWQVLAAWMTPEELKGAAKKDAIGYLAREADKGGREDIEKAVHTLQIYLELTK
jgi:hypothetical protein